jgi:hypothetical protein
MKTSWHIGHFGIPLRQVSQRLCPLVQRLMGEDIYSIHTGHSISFSVTSSVLDIPVSLATTGPSDLQRKLQNCQQVQLSADVTCEVQDDQKVSEHLMITVQKTRKNMVF